MNVLDSSAWLEYHRDGPNADIFEPIAQDLDALVVPALTIYEVTKKHLLEGNEDIAFLSSALMEQGLVVDVNAELAKVSAHLSIEHKLPMADATILATARAAGATLWTMDQDFEGLPGVEYVRHRD